MDCEICRKGRKTQVKGKTHCSVCTRRRCHKCRRPILNNQSRGSSGQGDYHIGGCPRDHFGGIAVIPPVQGRIPELVVEGMR